MEDKNVVKGLTFDDFIHSSMKLKHSIDLWNQRAKSAKNSIPGNVLPFSTSRYESVSQPSNPTFTLQEFVESIIYC